MEKRSHNTIYMKGQINRQYLINVPKILKILFKKYEWSGGRGSKLDSNVELPIKLKKSYLEQFCLKSSSLKLKGREKEVLEGSSQVDHDYYLFSFS